MVRSFPREMASIAALVEYVREFLVLEGFSEDAAFDLDLVLEELFTNLVKYGTGARGAIDVGLERGAPGLVLTLKEYDSDPYDPTAAPEVDTNQPIAERRPGGLGIHLVRRLSREFSHDYDWHDRTGVITVTMKETYLCSRSASKARSPI